MKALLLAAGLGTRMRPFTFQRAKASLPLLQVPLIHYSLQYLHSHQISDVVVNLHAHPETVKSAAGNTYYGMDISYSYEPEILGTAGAIRKAAALLDDEPFVVCNSDTLSDIPLAEVLEQHLKTEADVTLVIMHNEQFAQYGALYFEGEPLHLSGFRQGEGDRYHYTGLQIVSPSIVSEIPANQMLGIFSDIYPTLAAEKRIFGYLYDGLWKETGTLQEFLNTSLNLIQHPLPSHLVPPGMGNSLISAQADISARAEIINSVVMNGAAVPDGVRIENCIVGWDVVISQNRKNAALARGFLPWYF